MCQVITKEFKSTENSAFLIGGMSFIGAKLAVHLHSRKNDDIIAMEDVINVDRDPLKWYRWTEMMRLGIQQDIGDFSDVTAVRQTLKQHSFRTTLIYVPTMIHSLINDDKMWKPSDFYNLTRNFISTMEVIRKEYKNTLVLVILPSQGNVSSKYAVLQLMWSNLLIKLSEMYSIMHNVKVRLITNVNEIFGPWQDGEILFDGHSRNIDDVVTYIDEVLHYETRDVFFSDDMKMSVSPSKNYMLTRQWFTNYSNYRNQSNKDVVSGASLKMNFCYNCFFFKNNLEYIREWYLSAIQHDLNIVLIHNNFPDEFQTRLKSFYPNTEFYKGKCVNSKAATDQRFYILYEYLLNHTEINRIIFTDQRDVTFLTHPFQVMSAIGNQHIFLGYDNDHMTDANMNVWIKMQYNYCFPGSKLRDEFMKLAGYFNSGIIGGSRETVLALLSRMIVLFDAAKDKVCDMVVLGIVAHFNMYDIVFSQYPFNSAYMGGTPGPYGLAVKHRSSFM